MTTVVASVVMATHNRMAMLERAVAALEAQTGIEDYEIIVVDDGSTDGTAALLTRLTEHSRRLVPVILETNRGPAAARNVGWRRARADIIAFTDDDCRVEPGWLAALVEAVEEADIAQGRTIPDPTQAANHGPFSRTMSVEFEEGYYETCNVAYRRRVLEQEKGFDEAFRRLSGATRRGSSAERGSGRRAGRAPARTGPAYGEDTDLAWRAKKHGATTTFVSEALATHEVWPSEYRAYFREMRRRDGLVLLFSKHPELRAHLGKKLFFRPQHQHTLLAAGGLALVALRPAAPSRWVVGGGLGLLYAWACRHYRHRPPKKWQWLEVVPLAFVADVYDVAIMARASVRYRTLLL